MVVGAEPGGVGPSEGMIVMETILITEVRIDSTTITIGTGITTLTIIRVIVDMMETIVEMNLVTVGGMITEIIAGIIGHIAGIMRDLKMTDRVKVIRIEIQIICQIVGQIVGQIMCQIMYQIVCQITLPVLPVPNELRPVLRRSFVTMQL